jgi:hypothetical protein
MIFLLVDFIIDYHNIKFDYFNHTINNLLIFNFNY